MLFGDNKVIRGVVQGNNGVGNGGVGRKVFAVGVTGDLRYNVRLHGSRAWSIKKRL